MRILDKIFRRIYAYCMILSHQKKYKKVTYLFLKKNSNTLIVSFAGFSGMGKPPRYNYIDSLKEMQANRLYILDNHGYDKAGSYYLGEQGDWYLKDQIIELVSQIKREYNIEKSAFLGSSKGGWQQSIMESSARRILSLAGPPSIIWEPISARMA